MRELQADPIGARAAWLRRPLAVVRVGMAAPRSEQAPRRAGVVVQLENPPSETEEVELSAFHAIAKNWPEANTTAPN